MTDLDSVPLKACCLLQCSMLDKACRLGKTNSCAARFMHVMILQQLGSPACMAQKPIFTCRPQRHTSALAGQNHFLSEFMQISMSCR